MNNYIVVVRPIDLLPGYITAREVLTHRLSEGYWPLNSNTRHRNKIQKDDRFFFYCAGIRDKEKQCFLGIAISSSPATNIKKYEPELWLEPLKEIGVTIHDVDLFQKAIPIRPLLTKLQFIKSIKHWGAYLQGGFIKVTDNDFMTIINSQM